ncbi:type I-E CRISPR-associated protein Cas7/Cse4/CasC [Kitasatospora sp. NPDC092948]|uniref:type I-E CRISPR-associated protein Cas7/Cse4/CasC n=1 Tax=Kitasatospora sp. NPDC092948 TaxID=3364088 RepID=UPI0037F51334
MNDTAAAGRARFLDLHLLHTLPSHGVNRDDTGAPKSAQFGGVERARVSSQAWKRATRTYFARILDPSELGVRTVHLAAAVTDRLTGLAPDIDDAARALAAQHTITAAGITLDKPKRSSGSSAADLPTAKALAFLSAAQLDALAALAAEAAADPAAFFKQKMAVQRAQHLAATAHSVDVALFGRMVAETPELNVDAAVQVAQAIGVHALEAEIDYFTALDDLSRAASATMIGTRGFNSTTFYRYASLNLDALAANLGRLPEHTEGRTPLERAVAAWITAFTSSMPAGQNSGTAPHTKPELVLAQLRTEPASYVAAFEEPVHPAAGGHIRPACRALADHAAERDAAYGGLVESWLLRVGAATEPAEPLGKRMPTLDDLAAAATTAAAGHLTGATA